MILLAYRPGSTAPVLLSPPPGQTTSGLAHGNVADPVLQNFCLTAVVIGVALGGAAGVLLMEAPGVFGGRVLAHYLGRWKPVHGHALGIAFAAVTPACSSCCWRR